MYKYIISISHGEYDDHVEIPIVVVDDNTTADLLRQCIEDRDDYEFIDSLLEDSFPFWRDFDFTVDVIAVPYVKF